MVSQEALFHDVQPSRRTPIAQSVLLLLVLRLLLLRVRIATVPALRRPILKRYLSLSLPGASFHLLLYVGSILDVLVEMADMAADVVVGFEAKRYDRDEAEREPFPIEAVSF